MLFIREPSKRACNIVTKIAVSLPCRVRAGRPMPSAEYTPNFWGEKKPTCVLGVPTYFRLSPSYTPSHASRLRLLSVLSNGSVPRRGVAREGAGGPLVRALYAPHQSPWTLVMAYPYAHHPCRVGFTRISHYGCIYLEVFTFYPPAAAHTGFGFFFRSVWWRAHWCSFFA